MKQKQTRDPADFIVPLDMNGLQGRMLSMPAPKNRPKKEVLFVYGHHSDLERWWGLMQHLNKYGGVTMPDLPGFGGMDSFYKIGKKATLDDFADYLAAFVQMRYKRRRVIIVGLSFGFLVVTRMLQRYPELVKKVDMLVSLVGFTHHEDFTFSRGRRLFYRWGASVMSHRPTAWFFRYLVLRPLFIKTVYLRTHNARHKLASAKNSGEDLDLVAEYEVKLWHENDVRTYMATSITMFTVDNCRQRIDLPVAHVDVKADPYFDAHRVEQHMRVVFSDFKRYEADLDTHAPTLIADEKQASRMISPKLRRVLNNL